MGMNKVEIVAVVIAILVVFAGIGAGIGGLIVQEANGAYAFGLAEKTGTELTKITASDGTAIVVFHTADGMYINARTLINAYNGNTDKVAVYSVDGNGVVNGENSAPITFNHAVGILGSGAGTLLINLATTSQK